MSEVVACLYFFVFLTGICIGSFLNVVALRALSNESIVFPNSKCPKCQNPLKWWHNIPVISYIFLGGKCAFCKEKISIQYPIVELLTGCLFVGLFSKFGLSALAVFSMFFVSMLLVISITDIKEQCAFDMHSYILAAGGLIFNFFNFGNFYYGQLYNIEYSFIASILGLLLGAGIIGLYMLFGYLISKTQAIGSGDIFIAGAIGAVFGWQHFLEIILISFLIQVLITIPLFFINLLREKQIKTFAFLTSFFIFLAIYIYFYYILQFSPQWILNGSLIGLTITGIFSCINILNTLKNTESRITAPFGPAMAIASILYLFLIVPPVI